MNQQHVDGHLMRCLRTSEEDTFSKPQGCVTPEAEFWSSHSRLKDEAALFNFIGFEEEQI